MDRIERIVINSAKSKEKTNEDVILKQEIIQTNRPIPTEQLDKTVDITEVFKNERDISFCYRILGNINIVASNVLMNWDGDDSFQEIIAARDFDDESGEYVFDQEDILLEDDGWFYYLTGETSCDRVYLEPKPDRFALYNLSGDTNWNLSLTYPATTDEEDLIFNDVHINDGIAIYSGVTVIIDDRVMTAFVCSINHGLSVEDEVIISGVTSTGYEGIFNVYKLGFGDGTYTANTFIIDINLGVPPSFIGTKTSVKRRVEGIESQYYGRWFRKFSLNREVEVYNTAFANNFFNDQIYSYNFNRDYDITGFVDYLGRPVTEIYLSIIKKQDYSNNNGSPFWTLVESGLKTMLTGTEYDINTINTVTSGDSIEQDLNNGSDLIFGDIIEYNPVAQSETILEISYHRVNTVNREDNNFLEGFYYKPHYKIQLRKFSDYIGEAFSGDTDAPDYATQFSDGRVTWRDVLPNDFSNGNVIPFLNGCHYIWKCWNLLIQRQDPCGVYNMGNPNFVIGNCDVIEQFEEVEIIDVCE